MKNISEKRSYVNSTIYKLAYWPGLIYGQQRTIVSIEQNGRYLNVLLEGDILNVDEIGIPSEFKVKK